MKNIKYLIIALLLALSSCATVTYFGDKYPATTSVDIYYSAHDVKKDYQVIGHMNFPNIRPDIVKSRLADYAKSIGADAIIISGTQAIKDNQAAYVTADALKYK